jgi:hypothetical protein
LISLELIDFKVEKFYETAGCEFYVTLKALDLTATVSDPLRVSRSDRQALQIASLPFDLSNPTPTALPLSSVEATLSPQQIIQLQKKKEHQASRIQKLTSRLAAAHSELNAIQSSKSWKITAPLRWIQNRTLKALKKKTIGRVGF